MNGMFNYAYFYCNPPQVVFWANHSIGVFAANYSTMLARGLYQPTPSLRSLRQRQRDALAQDVLQGIRNCMRIFAPPKGNRTCFQICD